MSKETAVEMVKGLVKKTSSRAGISITGIAGPDGGTPRNLWEASMLLYAGW